MRRLVLHGAAVGLVAVSALLASVSSSTAATDRLPDLGMAPVTSVVIDTTEMPGRKLLRYTARIVNVGSGPFEVHGTRADTSDPTLDVVQRIFDDGGGYGDVPAGIGATMQWSGDGHNHWHVWDLESAVLRRVDNNQIVGTSAKHGFHIVDSFQYASLPGSPTSGFYNDGRFPSAKDPDALEVTMGISHGWGDVYNYGVRNQWIDITGLANGRYRLELGADSEGWFQETNTTNNTTWATLRIRKNNVTVLKVGPGA